MSDFFGAIFGIGFVITTIAAWLTHVVYCISHAYYMLLFLGAILAPIGCIHGVMVWFGYGVSG